MYGHLEIFYLKKTVDTIGIKFLLKLGSMTLAGRVSVSTYYYSHNSKSHSYENQGTLSGNK